MMAAISDVRRTLSCDVGSESVRVAIFQFDAGTLRLSPEPLCRATRPLTIYHPEPGRYEQRTEEIWSAFCSAAVECLRTLPSAADHSIPIHSIGFSATCSLVIVSNADNEAANDVIMWMDHRAQTEARLINETGHPVLEQFGGVCSPEFSLAKLVWLHRNQPERYHRAVAFMELPDWLSNRCSKLWQNSAAEWPRSLCSVVCKWGFDATRHRWPADLLLSLLPPEEPGSDHPDPRIGTKILPPGMPIGTVSAEAAAEIGLKPNESSERIVIASPLIDAHAGMLSMLTISGQYENHLCMISGTSTCHLMMSRNPAPALGIWGPYRDAILPGYYLGEAGQSATGKLIEHIIITGSNNATKHNWKETIAQLNGQLGMMQFRHQCKLIMNPTYHGNRSPVADPRLKGAIYGFTLDDQDPGSGSSRLLDLYVATVEGLAYETKLIVEKWTANAAKITGMIVSGGLTKNPFYLQMHADVLGHQLCTYDMDHMLAGASIIAVVATEAAAAAVNPDQAELANIFRSIRFSENAIPVRIFLPQTETTAYHLKKYRCYRKLLETSIDIENILMADEE